MGQVNPGAPSERKGCCDSVIPDAASQQAKGVEMFLQLAEAVVSETNPEFVINSMFGAIITFAHDHGQDPHRLQTAFRRMGDIVFQVYAQRNRVVQGVGNG